MGVCICIYIRGWGGEREDRKEKEMGGGGRGGRLGLAIFDAFATSLLYLFYLFTYHLISLPTYIYSSIRRLGYQCQFLPFFDILVLLKI